MPAVLNNFDACVREVWHERLQLLGQEERVFSAADKECWALHFSQTFVLDNILRATQIAQLVERELSIEALDRAIKLY